MCRQTMWRQNVVSQENVASPNNVSPNNVAPKCGVAGKCGITKQCGAKQCGAKMWRHRKMWRHQTMWRHMSSKCVLIMCLQRQWKSACSFASTVPFWNSKHPLPLRAAARSTSSRFLHHSQIRCSWRKPVSCREEKDLGTELWSPKSVAMYWLCSSVTTADKAFSLCGLETGLWAFQLQMFAPCDDMFVSHSHHSVLEFPSIHSQPEDWGSWEGYACIMPIPSLQLQKQAPVSCREAEALVRELCSPRFVTYNTVIVSKVWVTGYWLCSRLWHVMSDCCKPMTILASVGWKWGWQPFSCPCSLNAMHCRKEICLTCLSKESMPFVKSKCPLPTPNQKLEVPERDSTLQQFCIMLASCPSLRCSCRKKIRLMQRSKGFCSGVVVSKTCLDLLQCSDCALSCAIWLLRTHEHLSRLSF